MAVTVIGIYAVTLSCFFLCVLADVTDLKITRQQFSNFKGIDVSKLCPDPKAINDLCNKVSPNHIGTGSNTPALHGYPHCLDMTIQLRDEKGRAMQGTDRLLTCSWEKGKYLYLGKGKEPNQVTNWYVAKDDVAGIPTEEITVQ